MTHHGNSPSSRDVATVMHPQTNFRAHEKTGAFVVSRGEGVRIFDENGKEYIEAMAGLWCASLGFSEGRLADAAARQMRELPYYHVYNHRSHGPAIELAERLLAMMPVPMSKVYFCTSGSEANDTAVKFVWYYNNALGRPAKKKIVSRAKAFHGSTVAAGSLTGLPVLQRDFDLPIDRFLHTECPHHWRFGKPGETEEEFCHTACGLAGSADPGRRWGRDLRRLHRGTGHGCRRRDRAAAHLLRKSPEGRAQVRYADDRRRGDLRFRPHRKHVRLRNFRHRTRYHVRGKGSVLGLSADLRRGRE